MRASPGAFRNAELHVLLLSVPGVAPTFIVWSAVSVQAADWTRGHAVSIEVQHVVRVARADVGRHAASVDALVLADGIADAEVMNVTLVSGTALPDLAQCWG